VALPSALETNGAALAASLAGSIALGCGQFCTNPGVIVLVNAARTDAFVDELLRALAAQQPHVMLTAGMWRAFDACVAALLQHGAQALLHEPGTGLAQAPRPFLGQVSAARFIASAGLREEVFGPSSLVVRADLVSQLPEVLHAVGGSLTVTVWGAETENEETRRMVRAAMSMAGRVLFTGVPTGVAVTAAQQHGGPWPPSTAPMTTSGGDAAVDRFLRPVALQDAPDWLLERAGRPV
jgi:acyl-CoA reductase-like NAD-dependent aldehyde dehydrogenase